jgi:hypothetical protein
MAHVDYLSYMVPQLVYIKCQNGLSYSLYGTNTHPDTTDSTFEVIDDYSARRLEKSLVSIPRVAVCVNYLRTDAPEKRKENVTIGTRPAWSMTNIVMIITQDICHPGCERSRCSCCKSNESGEINMISYLAIRRSPRRRPTSILKTQMPPRPAMRGCLVF